MEGFGRLANMFGEGPNEPEGDGDSDDRGMPLKYSQNRMQNMGIGGIAAIGEAIVDKIRANRWNKQNPGAGRGPMLGPMGGNRGPGSPDVATRGGMNPEDYLPQDQFSVAPGPRRFIGG
jgi:hypothetical protein